jgi:hypothetical protein
MRWIFVERVDYPAEWAVIDRDDEEEHASRAQASMDLLDDRLDCRNVFEYIEGGDGVKRSG